MCEGCSAELQMKQMILEDGVMEDRIHYCKVLFGNEDQETLKIASPRRRGRCDFSGCSI